MLGYIFKRLLLTLPTLLLVSVGVFFLIRLIPGDPALYCWAKAPTPHRSQAYAPTWAWIVLCGAVPCLAGARGARRSGTIHRLG